MDLLVKHNDCHLQYCYQNTSSVYPGFWIIAGFS